MAFIPDDETQAPTGRFIPDERRVAQTDTRLSGIPNNWAATQQRDSPSFFNNLKGASEATLSVLSGIPAAFAGNLAGIYRGVTGGKYGTPEGAIEAATRAKEVSGSLIYRPKSESGKDILNTVGSVIDASKLAGLGPSEAMALAATAGPALRQINQSVVRPAASVIANSPEADLLKQGIVSARQTFLPMPKPEVAALAKKAFDLGIPLRPDMLTDNKFARMMGEAFEKVPISGSKADARQTAFNRAITAQIGGDRNATRLTPDVFMNAMETSGGKIGEIAAKTPISLDNRAANILSMRVTEAQKFLPSDIANVVTNYVDEIVSKGNNAIVGKQGQFGLVVPGETFRKINSQIGAQIRSSSNGDLRNALIKLQDDLHDLLIKNIKDPSDLNVLNQARKQYAIGTTLIPLVAESPIGNISPAKLMGAVTSTASRKRFMARGGGEMGDIARIGQLFLKEPSSSGSSERALVYGGALGGSYIEPHVAGSIYGIANLYNRAAPSITKGLVNTSEPSSFGMLLKAQP
tara:strand:- start:534 stop:2096 length:1563 start_codon:yes stop_codon:yes gene_type:complete